ncbi:MAG: DUF1893 domain-containing protein [Clostridiales bacterium]|nr:DUF1893 domain-containing protein [Clostridiales bacterium]
MTNLEIVKQRLYEKQASLIVMFNSGEIKEYYNKRVQDIVSILKENNNALNGAIIADKVIGKVAASLFTVAGVKLIYANTISEFAISILEKNNIKYEYKNRVDYIINNSKTGMCPMEEKFKDEYDLTKIYNYFVK